MKKFNLIAVATTLSLTSAGLFAPSATANDTTIIDDVLPVEITEDLDSNEIDILTNAISSNETESSEVALSFYDESGNFQVESINVEPSQSDIVSEVLNSQEAVEGAATVTEMGLFTDPQVSLQWALPAMQTNETRPLITGPLPIVAVIDSGIDVNHPDLDDVIVPGYDFVNKTTVMTDPNGHGTHVAGIIGAEVDNGLGGEGFLRNAKIMPIRALGNDGRGSTFNIGQGVAYAVENNAKVINLSLGGPTPDPFLESVLNFAESQGVTVLAAMGNEGLEGSPVNYPAAYSSVIAVSSINSNFVRSETSSVGNHASISAPGEMIFSTYPNNQYAYMTGTSMATPYAAATAAALIANGPKATPKDVKTILQTTAKDLGAPGFDTEYGYGLVNPVTALSLANDAKYQYSVPAAPTSLSVTPGNAKVTLNWNAPVTDGGTPITKYVVNVTSPTGNSSIDVSASSLKTDVTKLVNGSKYTFTVLAVNEKGNSSVSNTVTATPVGAPSAPIIEGLTSLNASARIVWSPTNNGGAAVTSYKITFKNKLNPTVTVSAKANVDNVTVTGLKNGVQYEATVQTVTSVGTSAVSNVKTVIPSTVPATPTILTATPANASAKVTWKASTANGGAGITGYKVTLTSPKQKTVTVTTKNNVFSANVPGLVNGAVYTTSVQAINVKGASSSSKKLTVTPRTIASNPLKPGLRSGPTNDKHISVTASWTAPASNGGSKITGYKVSLRQNGLKTNIVKNVLPSVNAVSFTGLKKNTKYTVVIQAVTAAGVGKESVRTSAILAK